MCHLIFFLPVFALPVFWFFPFSTALTVYLFICGLSVFIYFKIFQAMRLKPRTGKSAMLGKTCRVIRDIAPDGKIQYATEIWNATANGKRIPAGEKVIVNGFLGLTVQVVVIARDKNQ
jgi:membrane-bound ClpP family serine protease